MPARVRVLCLLTLSACSAEIAPPGPTAPVDEPPPLSAAAPLVAGRYELHRLNDRLVPHDFGPLPGRDGRPSACHYVLRLGGLDLTAGGGFELWYEYRCSLTSDQTVNRQYVAGFYTRPTPGQLRFRPGNNDSLAFSGRAYGDSVVFTWGDDVFGFRRLP